MAMVRDLTSTSAGHTCLAAAGSKEKTASHNSPSCHQAFGQLAPPPLTLMLNAAQINHVPNVYLHRLCQNAATHYCLGSYRHTVELQCIKAYADNMSSVDCQHEVGDLS